MSKISEVTQEQKESPTRFYKRLCDTYRIYSLFDFGAPENQKVVNSVFVTHCASYSHKKLRKLMDFWA